MPSVSRLSRKPGRGGRAVARRIAKHDFMLQLQRPVEAMREAPEKQSARAISHYGPSLGIEWDVVSTQVGGGAKNKKTKKPPRNQGSVMYGSPSRGGVPPPSYCCVGIQVNPPQPRFGCCCCGGVTPPTRLQTWCCCGRERSIRCLLMETFLVSIDAPLASH